MNTKLSTIGGFTSGVHHSQKPLLAADLHNVKSQQQCILLKNETVAHIHFSEQPKAPQASQQAGREFFIIMIAI
ncbi:MAG: hypothetical protein ACI3YZ_03085 [Prevotella sp.]